MKEVRTNPWQATPKIDKAREKEQAHNQTLAKIEKFCTNSGLFFTDLPQYNTWIITKDVSSLQMQNEFNPAEAYDAIQKIIKESNSDLITTLADGDIILKRDI